MASIIILSLSVIFFKLSPLPPLPPPPPPPPLVKQALLLANWQVCLNNSLSMYWKDCQDVQVVHRTNKRDCSVQCLCNGLFITLIMVDLLVSSAGNSTSSSDRYL